MHTLSAVQARVHEGRPVYSQSIPKYFISRLFATVYEGKIHKSIHTNNLAFRSLSGVMGPRGKEPVQAILGRLRASVVSLCMPRVYKKNT
jgi:hypothetical protein